MEYLTISLKDFLRLSTQAILRNHNIARPHIVCADGFSLSIQAGEGMYSYPRHIVEVYELDESADRDPDLYPYLESDDPQSVQANVPVDILQKVLDKHGGIALSDTLAAALEIETGFDLGKEEPVTHCTNDYRFRRGTCI